MKQQLFGLRKAQIDKLMKQIKNNFSAERNLLEAELNHLRAENGKLELELKEIMDRISSNKEEQDFWSFGKQRIERVIAYLKDQQEVEINEIENRFAETGENIKAQIEEVDREIQLAERIFTDTLNQFIDRIENPDANHLKKDNPQNVKENELGVHKLQETVEDPNDLPVKEIAAATDTTTQYQDFLQDGAKIAVEKDPEIPADKKQMFDMERQTQNNLNPFWGEVEEWANIDFTIMDAPPSPADHFIQIEEQFGEKVIGNEEKPDLPIKDEKKISNMDYRTIERESVEPGVSEQSEVLLEQIDAIKTQYIVGKVAGEDLYDINGQIIVSKNSLITRQVVETANFAGKLAELIVNMKLDGAGEG